MRETHKAEFTNPAGKNVTVSAADFIKTLCPARALIWPTVDAGPFGGKKGSKHTQESQVLVIISWLIQKIIPHSSSDVAITAWNLRAANEEVRICKRALPNTQNLIENHEKTQNHMFHHLWAQNTPTWFRWSFDRILESKKKKTGEKCLGKFSK